LAGENLFEPLIEPHFDMIGKRLIRLTFVYS
jgi:hypothetical protein